MTPTDLPWSDLRLVLAVAREGSFRAAAASLQLSHPTLSRRIAELQRTLGVQLFERQGRQLRLTEAGEDLSETAARIESEVDGLSRRIAGQDHRLEGVVRVAVSPSMFAALAPALREFSTQHPGIQLEFVTGLSMASLTRREADIAIRFTASPPETLVGRRLGVFEQAPYAHRRLRAQLSDDPRSWPWVDWDESHRHHASAQWLAKNLPDARAVVRCDSSLALYQLIRAGLGVGFGPTMLAAPDAELVRIDDVPELPAFERDIWVLTHADLRNIGRIRATVDWLCELLFVDGGGPWRGYPSTTS